MRLGSPPSARARLRPAKLSIFVIAVLAVVMAAVVAQAMATTRLGVTITTRPPSMSRSTSALFRWRTSGHVLHTRCSLDYRRFAPCRQARRYIGLRNGRHSFRVEVLSTGGSKRLATVRWRVDTIKPTAPVVSGGSLTWLSVPSIVLSAGGSTDHGSGVAAYQSRFSTNGGTSWSTPAKGRQVTVTADGQTLVEFRALDRAGNRSAWVPAPGAASATARIDRDAPSAPSVTGGSSQWQNAVSVDVAASGSIDVGGAGLGYYQYRTSTDGGTTWSAPTVGSDASVTAAGETLVQFRAVDAAGNASDWVPAAPADASTVRIDRTIPTSPLVAGGTAGWQSIAGATLTASGSTDALGGGIAYYEYRTSTDDGATWSTPTPGVTAYVSAEGETLVEFRAVDAASLDSAWTQVPVEIDRTAPTDPTVSGGSSAWQNVASIDITASSSTDTGGSGLAGYQYRTSTDGGTTWSAPGAGSDDLVTAEGETLVQLRAIDGAGNTSGWVQDTARIDRTLPTAPAVSGGSLAWQSVPSVDISATASTDAGGSGLAGYEYRTSTDGGQTWSGPTAGPTATISADGTTLVQFRAVDAAGNDSAWAPAVPDATDTVRLDRTAPTLSGVSGGSLTWQNAASVTVKAGTAADPGGSGFSHDEYRTSIDGGATWSGASTGSSLTISAEGETLVQYRAVDVVGNASAWAPASPGASDTVRIDRTAPTAPAVAGGSSSWQSVASIALTASSSTDAVSGLAGYQHRTSTNGGGSWSGVTAGPSVTISNEGATEAEFRAIDLAGNTSGWVVATANIDRTAPTPPTVTGGSASWRNVASIGLSAGGSTDSGGSALAGYRYRTSTDGGTTWTAPVAGSAATISAEGQTLVEFASLDNAGNQSAWVQATARIDRSAPTAPTVAGGSLSWMNSSPITITASGASDAVSGILRYNVRTSTNGGGAWSSPAPVSAPPYTHLVTAQGTTLVQFQAVDQAGNVSAWAPASPGASNTAKLDTVAPTLPKVSGGNGATGCKRRITIRAAGSTDATSGLAHYDYRVSSNHGATWGAPVTNSSRVTLKSKGVYVVQFRAVDAAGNMSAWAPAAIGTANTACIS